MCGFYEKKMFMLSKISHYSFIYIKKEKFKQVTIINTMSFECNL